MEEPSTTSLIECGRLIQCHNCSRIIQTIIFIFHVCILLKISRSGRCYFKSERNNRSLHSKNDSESSMINIMYLVDKYCSHNNRFLQ